MLVSLVLLLALILYLFFPIGMQTYAFFCTLGSFGYLIFAYITNDTSLLSVYYNSHIDTPIIYRIAAAWSDHEGSLLMWTTMIAGYGFFFCNNTNITTDYTKLVLRIHSTVCAIFLTLTLYSSNPFHANKLGTSLEGLGFNPILQDIAVTIHPPILYMGYSGFSLVFSIGLAATIMKANDKNWINIIKPWLMIAWYFLTIGICLGSWWAYRELGWGGFWFWDPVENISLMPWLLATALIHSLIMVKRFNILNTWSLFLSMIIFGSIIIGTSLVRSGLIDSVHSFAVDTTKGVYLLVSAVLFVILPIVILLVNYKKITNNHGVKFRLFSQQTAMIFNNLFLVTGYIIILIGIFYPIISEHVYASKISIGSPYYSLGFVTLTIPTLIIGSYSKNIATYTIKALISTVISLAIIGVNNVLSTVILALSVIFAASAFEANFHRKNPNKVMIISHLGIAFIISGITICSTLQTECEGYLKPTQHIMLNSYQVTLVDVQTTEKTNYIALKGYLRINNGKTLTPELRFYTKEKISTPEAAIVHSLFADLYTTIINVDEKLGLAIKVYYKPGIQLIWLGGALIALSFTLQIFHWQRHKLHSKNKTHSNEINI